MIRQIILALLLSAVLATSFQGAVLSIQEIDLKANQTKAFKLPNIDSMKALMINLKHDENIILQGPFSILLTKEDNSQVNCFFKYSSNLCVIQRPTSGIKVEVKCEEKACQMSLVFSQRGVINLQQLKRKKISLRGDILVLPKKKHNTIMQIFAQKEEYVLLSSQIKVFSNIHAFHLPQIQQLDMNSAVYGLKPIRKEQDQFIFIDYSINRTEFLQVQFKTNDGKLSEGISVTDFIENYGKHSHSNYTFAGDFKKNIQIKMRMFAPKDADELPIILKVKGKKTQQETQNVIRSLKFQPINFEGHSFYDFSFSIAHSLHSIYSLISFEILIVQVEDKAIFFQISVYDVEIYSINIFQHVFFGCAAKDELKFSVEPQVRLQLAGGEKQIQIVTNSHEKYFTDIQTCSLQKGCQISIKADEICDTCSYSFDLEDQQFKNHIIYYEVSENIIEGKIDFEEQLFFKYAINGLGMVQIVINSPNVIIYANIDGYQRCSIPTSACHQYAATHLNPVLIKNSDTNPTQITVGVLGLQKASFIVKFLTKENGLTVKLGEKLSYHMDDQEDKLEIRMEVDRQQFIIGDRSIHFNLISPIHSTKLSVTNGQRMIQSNNGYITFLKEEVNNELFIINIQKMNAYQKSYLHFTLIVSSSETKVRLETSTIHYEQYMPQQNKTFIFEYDSRDSSALNIFTQNLQKSRSKMTLTLSNAEEIQGEKKIIISKPIVGNSEFIDISKFIQEEQICGQISCELELMISNDGTNTLQQTITLISQTSLINLDDSIWSTFQINSLTKRSHFYFVPRQENKPITIIFNTDDNRLYLNYRIFSTENNQNPQNWPFDHQETDKEGHISNSQTITISAEDPQLQKCWPDCVIIMNLNEGSEKQKTNQSQVIQTYKILATNSLFQLPENTKLQFTLRNQQVKSLFISIADILSYERLTFFTYFSFGRAKISAQIFYDQKLYKIGKYKNNAFHDLQTVIYTTEILQTLGLELIPKDSALLQITIRAQTMVKMTLQYTSYLRELYKLRMDELQFLSLREGQKVWYQFIPERDFNIKLYRLKGFPIVQVIRCQEDNYVQCLTNKKNLFEAQAEQLKKQSDKIKKDISVQSSQDIVTPNTTSIEILTQKSFDYKGEACKKCIYFLWIYEFQGDLQMTLNLRTSKSQIQLKEQASINDQATFKQRNRYLINVLPRQDTIISIKVLEGGIGYIITDSDNSYQNGTIAFGQNSNKDIVIEGLDNEQEQSSQQGQGKLRSFSNNNIFKHVHLSIYGLTQKMSEYIISYSVGQSSLYLQDGVIAQRNTGPYWPLTFYYHNKNKKQHAYLTLTSQPIGFSQQTGLKGYDIKFYYYPDASNRHQKELFKPEKPPKRNQNYLGSAETSVYQLPAKYQLIQIYITATEELKFFASINHQELIYLPLDFEYLIKLHPQQSLNLVIDNPNTEYLQVNVKKCDGNQASIMYTNDAKQFRRGIFEVQKQIDSHIFKQFIKTKKDSKTIHLKLISLDSQSLLSITVKGRTKQSNEPKITFKPGNSGKISYKMWANKKAQIVFEPATCNEKECSVNFNYFLVIAESIEQIYGELNCAGTYFIPQASQMLKKGAQVIFVGNQFYNKQLGHFVYPVTLQNDSAFIGVKAVVSDKEIQVRYLPIEIGTIWSQLRIISPGWLMVGSFVVALLLTIIIIVSTKLARRGYKPISSQQ